MVISETPDFKNKPGVLVVAMTATAMAGDKEKWIDAGRGDYIPTLVERDVFSAALKE